MEHSKAWYVVKRESGCCEILIDNPETGDTEANPSIVQHWGPFDSPEAAIARRVGLIRAGKCRPVQPTL